MFLIGCQSTERPESLRKGVEARMHEIIDRHSTRAQGSLALTDGRKFTASTDAFIGDGTASPALLKVSRQLWEKARDAGATEAQLKGSWFKMQVDAKGKFQRMDREGLGIALPFLNREPAFLGQVGEIFMPDGKSAVAQADSAAVNGVFDAEEITSIADALAEAAAAAGIPRGDIRAGSGVVSRMMSLDAFVSGSRRYIATVWDPGSLTKNFILMDESGRAVGFDVKRIGRDPGGYDIYEVRCPDIPEMPKQMLRATAAGEVEIRLPNGEWSQNVRGILQELLDKTRSGKGGSAL